MAQCLLSMCGAMDSIHLLVVANSQAHQSASLKSLSIPKQEISLRAKGCLFVVVFVVLI